MFKFSTKSTQWKDVYSHNNKPNRFFHYGFSEISELSVKKMQQKMSFFNHIPAVSYTLSLALFGLAVDEQEYSWGACVCKLH